MVCTGAGGTDHHIREFPPWMVVLLRTSIRSKISAQTHDRHDLPDVLVWSMMFQELRVMFPSSRWLLGMLIENVLLVD